MSLRGRVEKLEATVGAGGAGGGACPRCSGVFAVRVNGRPDHASRNGEPMSADEHGRFEAEGVGGRCPACDREPLTIRLRGHFAGEDHRGA